jgi:zinc protease
MTRAVSATRAAASSDRTAAIPEALRGVSTFTLDNGLVGVTIEDRRAPVVTHMVWYRVGSADEPAGRSGVAHFLEHLMFKGTPDLPDGEFSRIVAQNGGMDNAFTSTDYTAYFQRIASDRLEMVMAMEADRMVDLAPAEAAVLSERDVILEERRQVVENNPDGPYGEARRAAFYINHPYGRPVIGWEHEIAAYTRDAALDFYRRHYAPNNAILVVAGDVDPATARRLAEIHYGPIPARADLPPRARPQEPPHRAARRVELVDARVREPSIDRHYLAEPRRPGDQARAAALTVLAELLGAGVTSVLSQALVFKAGVALSASAGYSDTGVDAQAFSLTLTPKPDVSLAAAEAALDAALAAFLAEGPDAAQLDRVKGRIRAAEIYALDDQARRARRIGAALACGLSLEDVGAWAAALDAVTAADVRAAAEATFRPERSVTGWLRAPDAAAADGGR